MSLLLISVLFACPLPEDALSDAAPEAVRLLDVDGDGRLDKLYLGANGSVRVALFSGGRQYDPIVQDLPRVAVAGVLVADLDQDGALDLLLLSPAANVALCGDGTGRFTVATDRWGLANAGDAVSAERVDLDEDGVLDLLLHNRTHDVVYYSRGDGTYERDPDSPPINEQPVGTAPSLPEPLGANEAVGAVAPTPAPETTGSSRSPRDAGGLSTDGPTPTHKVLLGTVRGTGTAGTLPKWIAPFKLGDSELVESGGNLGVGTAAPTAKLDVAGDVAVNGSQVINGSGQWVGDPTGLIGPAGPPGVISFGTANTRGGTDALLANTTGSHNSAFGVDALTSNTTGYANTATGSAALQANTDGAFNTANGVNALRLNTTGFANTASGVDALYSNTTGRNNTASGYGALRSNTFGLANTASGWKALHSNSTGRYNTANGYGALRSNTLAGANTASGWNALSTNTTGSNNTASGFGALLSNSTGFNNTASGIHALSSNKDGDENTANGGSALRFNTTGRENTATGHEALRNNTTGDRNAAVGSLALGALTTGSRNTAVGAFSLQSNQNGDRNIAIGYSAGISLLQSNNIAIGSSGLNADAGTIRIGSAPEQSTAFIAGIRGVTTAKANAIPVLIDGAGQLGTVSSSRRFKEDIVDMGRATERLLELRTVLFRYKSRNQDGDGPIEFGLIAEEVAEVFPELVVFDDAGEPFTVKYHLLSTMLLNELQKENRRVAGLEERVAALESTRAEAP